MDNINHLKYHYQSCNIKCFTSCFCSVAKSYLTLWSHSCHERGKILSSSCLLFFYFFYWIYFHADINVFHSYTYFGIQERWVTPALWSTALFVSFRIEGADGSGLKILWSLTWEENGHLTWSLCCLRGPQVSIPMAFWQICSALSSNEPPSKEGPQPLIVSFFEGKSKHWERERNPLLIVGLIEPVCRGELGQKPGDSGLSCSATWEEAWSSSQSRIWPLEPDMPNYAPHLATSESLQCILPQFPHL